MSWGRKRHVVAKICDRTLQRSKNQRGTRGRKLRTPAPSAAEAGKRAVFGENKCQNWGPVTHGGQPAPAAPPLAQGFLSPWMLWQPHSNKFEIPASGCRPLAGIRSTHRPCGARTSSLFSILQRPRLPRRGPLFCDKSLKTKPIMALERKCLHPRLSFG